MFKVYVLFSFDKRLILRVMVEHINQHVNLGYFGWRRKQQMQV